jgi:hypothetical protein
MTPFTASVETLLHPPIWWGIFGFAVVAASFAAMFYGWFRSEPSVVLVIGGWLMGIIGWVFLFMYVIPKIA